ncbi:PREDICTED: RNA-binding protein 4.1-like isoform X3 [Trachymyrmex septentrionalis]|uniref:RNA-binding protein 4.1 isoform X1 n=1 Tax=Mycetomoellerius zeteki TaxID=64791 RepID=UPI00084E72FA|nr:PREDICTED: RNA-binding protein 4.1-like isoform X1 [Trachymyrmex zeteki]XP_018345849.1 PREDICTED: RNA-binding protein 4.1-like isoform X3 [Trachymyrmex septentrionalis]
MDTSVGYHATTETSAAGTMVSSNQPRKTKIFVGRLPENCRNDELRQLFLRFGEVTECDVMNRYGFVHMAREEDAAAAIKALHNSNFKGATINVEQSTGKSRGGGGGRRDDRRGGPMRGGRGGRDGGRDARPGPYNDRRGGVATGYTDYNRGAGDFSGRGADFGAGYGDRGAYGQNVGGAAMGYTSTAPGMGGGYGPAAGAVGGYGPTGAADYGRTADYGRADFGARTDYGVGGGMAGDFNRGAPGPVDYGRTDNFGASRTVDYTARNDYDRSAAGPMRNGGAVATTGYGTGYTDVGYDESHWPMSTGPSYSTGAPSYSTGPGPQADMFSRRPGSAVPSGGYPPVASGYAEGYDRPDAYGPPRGGGRFPGPADAMPPRY